MLEKRKQAPYKANTDTAVFIFSKIIDLSVSMNTAMVSC